MFLCSLAIQGTSKKCSKTTFPLRNTTCTCMFYYTCTSTSKCTLHTCMLTEYKCKSTQPEGCSLSMCRWVDWRATRKHHRDKELVSQLCVTFYWNRKSKEVNGTKKKEKKGEKPGREGCWLSIERSLSARGELLQVMDAVLVNQTDVEGGKVQDEAPVQLEEGETRQENKY